MTRMTRRFLVFTGFGLITGAVPVPAADPAATQLRLVADHVLKHTTRRLIDRNTGETFADSAGLAPKPEISIESKFNAWFYQTWLLTDGMRRVAESLDEPRYRGYGEANLEFIYRHMDYFQRQHDAGMKAAPVGDGKLSPIGFYFDIGALWHTGLAPMVLERSRATKDPAFDPYLERIRRFLRDCPRFDDGLFYRGGKVTLEGDLVDVCASTDVGDLAYYLNRPRLQGDLHGFGSYLLAGAEIVRMLATGPGRGR